MHRPGDRSIFHGEDEIYSRKHKNDCFDFLKTQVSVSEALVKRSEGEAVLALWFELETDLEELDMYGGGDSATENQVAELLDQIRERLESQKVDADSRQEILEVTLPFIESGNAGMDDMLYDVAYAGEVNRLKISMLRKEYDEALAILTRGRYPMSPWGCDYEIQVAQKLDNATPKKFSNTIFPDWAIWTAMQNV